jgi:hypothetical protein
MSTHTHTGRARPNNEEMKYIVGYGVREAEIEGRTYEIQDLRDFEPQFYANGVQEASDAGLGLGVVGCLLQVGEGTA